MSNPHPSFDTPYHLDKRRVRESFDRAAEHYDDVAVLQREVADRLLERLGLIKLQPSRVLDLGSGTGHCSRGLARHYPKAEVVSVDIAPGMLRYARRRLGLFQRLRHRHVHICGDAEAVPLADDSVDLLFSSLTLQWCEDLDNTFREFMRVLRPGGLLMFSTFGPDTLRELRASWSAADGVTHVNQFIDMHDIGDALVRTRFADPVLDQEQFTLTYADVRGLMDELKQLGAHNATAGRAHGLTGKGRLRAMMQAYEEFRRDGVLPVTYEVAYGHAWVPEIKSRQARLDNGTVAVPLSDLRRSGR